MDQSSLDRIARLLGGVASRSAGFRAAISAALGMGADISAPSCVFIRSMTLLFSSTLAVFGVLAIVFVRYRSRALVRA